MQAGIKNIEQPELIFPEHCWNELMERKNNQEIVSQKVAFSINRKACNSNILSECHFVPWAVIASLSLKSGFDRKIYLHNITA